MKTAVQVLYTPKKQTIMMKIIDLNNNDAASSNREQYVTPEIEVIEVEFTMPVLQAESGGSGDLDMPGEWG